VSDFDAWKQSPPEWLPPIGSLVKVDGWKALCVVIEHKPLRYSAGRPKRWKVVVQDPGLGGKGSLRFPHERDLLEGWWSPGKLVVHPPDGEPYDAAVGPGGGLPGLASFSSVIKPKKLRQFYRMLQKAGYEVSFTKNQHVQIKCPDRVVHGPATSGSRNSWRRMKTKCLQAGIPKEVFEGW